MSSYIVQPSASSGFFDVMTHAGAFVSRISSNISTSRYSPSRIVAEARQLLRRLQNAIPLPSRRIIRWLAIALAILAAGLLAQPILWAILNAIGFQAGGVAAGSAAAAYQSAVLGAHTTGFFSVLQSLGATMAAPAVGTVVTGCAAAVGSVVAWFRR
ncbi:hypothetical protein CC1G_12066 [Coprinopsis cinerea okayama7|uniref:Uncharacterized protein n=1 Tax=Coprinopsis cinerea (strain Okayama-7 / 130 / ATCC MYA-4618 / FGSC 9003) TaxID=240176 RepID=A8N0D5_COPC7|nr:hypothetical protein CC1G_12066 [Coprinopsis cinerea okayama7\|eukprot:XP_001828336.1 hypothetical protein CC1G_12066 [Coprinopsis cinerea okayama7\